MQKVVGDRLRPADSKDPFGVEQAKTRMRGAYDIMDKEMATRTWAAGETFTLADCAACPALFYADLHRSPAARRRHHHHPPRHRRAARTGVRSLHRSAAPAALLGPEGIYLSVLRGRFAGRRRVPPRHARTGRRELSVQRHLSRDR